MKIFFYSVAGEKGCERNKYLLFIQLVFIAGTIERYVKRSAVNTRGDTRQKRALIFSPDNFAGKTAALAQFSEKVIEHLIVGNNRAIFCGCRFSFSDFL